MLEAVGITVELVVDPDFFSRLLFEGAFEATQFAWGGAPGLNTAIGIHNEFDPSSEDSAYSWEADEETRTASGRRYVELVRAMQATSDEAELRAIISEAEQILADELMIIPLYGDEAGAAWWEDRISGGLSSYLFGQLQADAIYRTDR